MIVAIYARVSTDQQAEKGYSLDTQLAECRNKVQEIPLVTGTEEFVDDGYSGAYFERPALDELRQGLRDKRFGAVIVYDPDRLARNLTHQLILTDEIEDSGAQLIFVNFEWQNTPEGKLFYSIRGAVSAYEREKIKERSQRGKRGKALAGKVIRNNRPYGYDWDSVNSIYIVNEEEAEMVRQIFSWVVNDHFGIRAIATLLAEQQKPTRTARNSWNISTVHDIITRETYCGIHWSNREYKTKIGQNKTVRGLRDPSEWIPVPVPAIVSRETWEAAQRQLKLNRRITRQPFTYEFLCRNITVCPLCGEPMRSVVSGERRKPYYACKTGRAMSGRSLIGGSKKCPARQVPAKDVDEYVWQYISTLLKDPDLFKDELIKDGSQSEQSIKDEFIRLKTKEEQLIKEREKVTLLFRQELIDLPLAEKQLTEIKNALAAIGQKRRLLEQEFAASNTEEAQKQILERQKELAGLAETEDPTVKRRILLSVVKKIEVQRIDKNWNKPEVIINISFGNI